MALIVISGPSGAGKSSLCKALLARGMKDLKLSISHTTRTQRPGEVAGVDYHFVSREVFLKMLSENRFLEHTEYSGNLYGTSKEFLDLKCNILFDLDHRGAMAMRKYASAALIFCAPPSLEALESRLNARGEKDIKRRMLNAQEQMNQKDLYDYIIVNEKLNEAEAALSDIISKLVG